MPGWSRLRLYLRAAHAFHEDSSVFPDEDEPAPPPTPPQQPSCQSKLASFVVKNFLLCGLSLAVVLALAVPSWGIAAAALKLPVVGKLSNARRVAIPGNKRLRTGNQAPAIPAASGSAVRPPVLPDRGTRGF